MNDQYWGISGNDFIIYREKYEWNRKTNIWNEWEDSYILMFQVFLLMPVQPTAPLTSYQQFFLWESKLTLLISKDSTSQHKVFVWASVWKTWYLSSQQEDMVECRLVTAFLIIWESNIHFLKELQYHEIEWKDLCRYL